MSLEQVIAENTAALIALREVMAGAKVAVPAAAPAEAKAEKPAAAAKAEKPAKAKPAPKEEAPASEHTREEMQAALSALKEAQGAPAAKTVIKDVGGVDKMAEIPEDKIDAVYEAATAAMETADEDM